MKSTFLFAAAILLSVSLLAQNHSKWQKKKEPAVKGKVTGILLDSMTNKPVEFATAVLVEPRTGKEVNGIITNEKGQFKLIVDIGTYDLNLSFLGYETKVLKGIHLTPKRPDVNLKKIVFASQSLMLEEVTVTGEAAIIETKIDKIVYNAEKDVTNAGGDAADVLRKVPLLSVDMDGNVTLRGSSNIRILINGRPSGMFSSSVADALKSIPADQIKSVEVITSPTAKYDGEGSAGILNIITKKKRVQGFTGSVNSSVGTRLNNSTVNLSAAKGRFGFNGGGSVHYSLPSNGTFDFDRTDTLSDGQLRSLMQDGVTRTSRIGFHGNAGAFYDINAYNAINSSLRFHGFSFDRNGNTDARLFDPARSVEDVSSRKTLNNSLTSGFDWTNDYTKTFAHKKGKELSFGFQLSGNVNNQDSDVDQGGNHDYLSFRELSNNDGTNLETTLQVDYAQPFGKKYKLEVGAKTVFRDLQSDYQFDTISVESSRFIADFARSNIFDYNQRVYAGYASWNLNLGKKYGLVAGARYEYTDIDGKFEHDNPSFNNTYGNLLPSFIFSRKLKNFSSLKVSYTKRIQRPSLFFINPYTNETDRNNRTQGNPKLNPEITHQVELGYNTFIKGIVLNAAVYYKRTNDIIESFLTGVVQEGDEVFSSTTYLNIGHNNTYGFNFFGSGTIKKILTIRGNINLSSYSTRSQVEGINLTNDGVIYSSFVTSTLSFKNGIKVEGFGMFRSSRRTLQGSNPSFSMYSFGARKELFKKRGNIGIRIVQLFSRSKSFNSRLEGDGFKQTSLFSIPFRSYGLSFGYRFGKLDFKAKERRSRIKNDDLKKGGDGDQNF